jgi:hypothetical protein
MFIFNHLHTLIQGKQASFLQGVWQRYQIPSSCFIFAP